MRCRVMRMRTFSPLGKVAAEVLGLARALAGIRASDGRTATLAYRWARSKSRERGGTCQSGGGSQLYCAIWRTASARSGEKCTADFERAISDRESAGWRAIFSGDD